MKIMEFLSLRRVTTNTFTVYLLISKWKLLQPEFVKEMDPSNNTIYFYLNLSRNLILAAMFVFEWTMLRYSLFLAFIVILQFLLVLVQANDKNSTTDELIKERLVLRIANFHLLIIMFLIWATNIFPTENMQKLWAFTITEFFIFFLFISVIIKFIKINK